MSVQVQLEALVSIAVALMLSGIVGLDREWRQQPAGIRTHMLVGVGAALVAQMAELNYPADAAARLVAGVISGIGFLGAGAILQRQREVHGLTTAASIWLVAIIGLTTGLELYVLAGGTTLIGWFVLTLLRMFTKGHVPPDEDSRPKEQYTDED